MPGEESLQKYQVRMFGGTKTGKLATLDHGLSVTAARFSHSGARLLTTWHDSILARAGSYERFVASAVLWLYRVVGGGREHGGDGGGADGGAGGGDDGVGNRSGAALGAAMHALTQMDSEASSRAPCAYRCSGRALSRCLVAAALRGCNLAAWL